jgi:hypothetical protein
MIGHEMDRAIWNDLVVPIIAWFVFAVATIGVGGLIWLIYAILQC